MPGQLPARIRMSSRLPWGAVLFVAVTTAVSLINIYGGGILFLIGCLTQSPRFLSSVAIICECRSSRLNDRADELKWSADRLLAHAAYLRKVAAAIEVLIDVILCRRKKGVAAAPARPGAHSLAES